MFNHIMIGSNDIERSKRFYDAVLGVLGAGSPLLNKAPTGHTRWFYRHADLSRTVAPVDAAPNELFFSSHADTTHVSAIAPSTSHRSRPSARRFAHATARSGSVCASEKIMAVNTRVRTSPAGTSGTQASAAVASRTTQSAAA